MGKQLSEIAPSPSRIATSSPFGGSLDFEVGLWGSRFGSLRQNDSPLEVRNRAEFLRHRLIALLEAAESRLETSNAPDASDRDVLLELGSLYGDYLSLRHSPESWQNIHTEDGTIAGRVARVLRRHNIDEL